MSRRKLVIAIDGPSGAGKSTAGRGLARRLGYVFLDTGAMYRAVALKALREGVPVDRGDLLAGLARTARIELEPAGEGVFLDGEDVTSEIRTREVTSAASRISIHPEVRKEMVARQRDMGREGGIVLDGRDIGTAVFPNADVKFYLDADPKQRSERRYRELSASGGRADLGAVERETRERDHLDSTRTDSPLTRAPDAVLIDTTGLAPEEVLGLMIKAVDPRLTPR